MGLTRKNIRAGAEASLTRLGAWSRHRSVLRARRRSEDADRGTTPRIRRVRPRGQGAVHRRLEFHRGPPGGRAGDLGARRAGALRRDPAPLQPGRQGRIRGPLSDVCARERVACVPYFALAKAFLPASTGLVARRQSAPRAPARISNDRGQRLLTALDEIAAAHDTSVAAVSLAWLRDRPAVVAPIASARTLSNSRNYSRWRR